MWRILRGRECENCKSTERLLLHQVTKLFTAIQCHASPISNARIFNMYFLHMNRLSRTCVLDFAKVSSKTGE
jgi:hypothetical protein